jgi:predicted dehydrogenase
MKVAVIGTGGVAERNYLPFLSKQQDVELSMFSRTAAKAQACAAKFGGRVASSVEDLMSDSPDTVFILTGEKDRYEATNAVLPFRPKRIFFEKPLVAMQDQAHVTEDDFVKGREIMLKAKEISCETAMIFNYRFFDQSLRAAKILADRSFGKPVQVTALVHYACWSHCIDLIHQFAGQLVEITALSGSREHDGVGMKAFDVSAAFVTQSGATGTIIGTSGIDFAFPLFEMLFCFEGGRFTLRDLDGDMEVLDYAGNTHERYALTHQTSRWQQYDQSFDKSVDAYLNSLRNGTPPPVPGIAGLQELQFEAALKRSIQLNRPVKVQEEFSLL